jgi:hypothetical protein
MRSALINLKSGDLAIHRNIFSQSAVNFLNSIIEDTGYFSEITFQDEMLNNGFILKSLLDYDYCPETDQKKIKDLHEKIREFLLKKFDKNSSIKLSNSILDYGLSKLVNDLEK